MLATNYGVTALKKIIKIIAIVIVSLVVLIQLVPYGRSHDNPAVVAEPQWSSPQVREIAVRACYDCHSNQSKWPWYSNIAPVSWLVAHDVEEGRSELNFSRWDVKQRHIKDAAEEVLEGEMPMWEYLLVHPEAKLSADEQAQLVTELKRIAALSAATYPDAKAPKEEREEEESH